MREHVIEELEAFIERGDLWDLPAIERLVGLLERETDETGDPSTAMLAKVFSAIVFRMKMLPMTEQLAADVEAHVYQRLYKVLEAEWDDLPEAEVRTRVEVFQRRLSRMIVDENPRPVDAEPPTP